MITLTEFKSKGWVVPMPNTNEVVRGKHHKQSYGQAFDSTQRSLQYAPCVYNMTLVPGTDTVFLPYYQDQCASVRLPSHGPRFFVTSNLSGCAVYIGKNNNDRLVVIHSNSQSDSGQAVMDSNRP